MKINKRGEKKMETKNKYMRIRVVRQETARELDIDPAELWLDQDIEPEALIELDPLDIDADMVDDAEQPEVGDPLLCSLSKKAGSAWSEQKWLRQLEEGRRPSKKEWLEKVTGSK
jgi:hypothetical protein